MKLGIFKYVGMLAIAAAFAMLPSVASAQGPTGSYASGIACVNLGTSETAVTVEFIRSNDGSVATRVTNDKFTPGTPYQLFTTSINGLDSGFLGSAVVSSGQEVACSVNTQTSSGTSRVGTANGLSASDIGPSIFATQILNNLGGFDSYVAVQNAGDAAASVTAKYFNSSGTEVFSQKRNIPAKASTVWYQEDAQAQIGDGFIGSATFTADDGSTPLAGAVAIYNEGTAAANAQFLSYNTFTAGANKLFMPRLSKNLSGVGYTSGFSCQNVGPGTADISMAVTMLDQDSNSNKSATLTKAGLAEGQAWAVFMGNTGDATIDAIAKGFGSAVVTSTGGKIACTVNEDNRSNFAGQGTTTAAVPDGQQSKIIQFSQIVALGANSFRGGFQIANTTGNATTCTYKFSNGDSVTADLAANGANSVFAESVLVNNKTSFNGSVEVTCGEPIVGIYNLTSTAPGDPFAANNGINR